MSLLYWWNGGVPMEMVSSYCHLGHLVTSSRPMDDSLGIMSPQSSFIGQVNSVLSLLCFFGKLSSDVKIRLFRSAQVFMAVNCGTYHVYSSLSSARNGGRVLHLPLQTHCYLLPLLCRCLPVFDEISNLW